MAINRKVQYADQYQPDFGIPWTPILSPDKLAAMSDERLGRYTTDREAMELAAIQNPVGAGWTLPMWRRVMENYGKYNIHVLLGGNQCVHGRTVIFDPIALNYIPISDRREEFHVLAWDGEVLVEAKASKPFEKGFEAMIEIAWDFSPGACGHCSVICTRKHKLMQPDGAWVHAGELCEGDSLLAPWSTGGVTAIRSIREAGDHPVWDITVPDFGNYWCNGAIHSNSGKTVFGSRMTVWAAGSIPEAETYCWHVSEKRSIDDQQRFIYDALPPGIKNLPTKKGINHSTQYSQKNGFTDSICILPPQAGHRRGGSINFFNYSQFSQNQQIIEGIKAHFVWADEKIPLSLLDTLKYRLFTYHGRLLLTYTVIDGWNDTIEKILSKTRTIERRYSDRLRCELPVIQESLSMDSCCIYYAWTDDNPFTDAKEFWKLNATSDKSTILARAYGIPTKSIQGAFPAFNRELNVVPHEQLPFVKDPAYKVTRYMGVDPGGAKNWFMVWVAIDAAGTWWVYREWPDFDDWALPGSTLEGKAGPAQKGSGKGIKEYVELVRDCEKGESIYERLIDPRMGAAVQQSQDGASTIISELDACDLTVIPAPGVDIENGLQLINNLLAWNEGKDRDAINHPHLYVSDRVQNLIFALSEYTARGGPTEATKDPIDALRYIAVSNAEFIESYKKDVTRTGVY